MHWKLVKIHLKQLKSLQSLYANKMNATFPEEQNENSVLRKLWRSSAKIIIHKHLENAVDELISILEKL